MKKTLSILLMLVLVLTSISFTFATNELSESTVIYECDDILTLEEIDYRIKNGITDVPEEETPIDVIQSFQGDSAGMDSTYIGSTTQLVSQSVQSNGLIISEYKTTAAFELTSTGSVSTPMHGASATVYLTAGYNDNFSSGYPMARVKLTDIRTNFKANDPAVSISKLQLYETSVGNMYSAPDGSGSSFGKKTINTRISYKDYPVKDTVYSTTNCTVVNSLTGYWVQAGTVGTTTNYAAGKAIYTFINNAGNPVSYFIELRIHNDGIGKVT